MALTRRQIQGARLHTVLTLEVRGRRYRYSDAAFSMVNSDASQGPAMLAIAAGLEEPDIIQEVATQGAGLEAVSVAMTCGEEWSKVIAGIQDASGELAQVREGDGWESRDVLAAGRVSEPVYGASAEPIEFSLGGDIWEDVGVLPQPTWQVCASTWPRPTSAGVLLPEDSNQTWYNIVFGWPGQGLTAGRPCAAALVEIDSATNDNSATDAIVLLAYGHITCTSAIIYNDTQVFTATLTPSYAVDGRGTPVTIVTVAVGDMAITNGDELWWRPLAGGGLRSLTGTGTLRSAGEVISWILGYATVPVDITQTLSAIAQLQAYLLDFVVSEPISPIAILTDQILPILPVALAWGQGGAYLAAIPWQAVAKDAVWKIDPDVYGGFRSGKVTSRSWRDLRTVIRLDYAIDLQGNNYLSSLTHAFDADGSDPLYQPHTMLVEIATRWPGVRAQSYKTDVVCDPATAATCLDYLTTMAAMLWVETSATLPQEYQAMKAGDVVSVTLPDIEWSERVCYATQIPRIAGDIVVSVRTLPNWIRG